MCLRLVPRELDLSQLDRTLVSSPSRCDSALGDRLFTSDDGAEPCAHSWQWLGRLWLSWLGAVPCRRVEGAIAARSGRLTCRQLAVPDSAMAGERNPLIAITGCLTGRTSSPSTSANSRSVCTIRPRTSTGA